MTAVFEETFAFSTAHAFKHRRPHWENPRTKPRPWLRGRHFRARGRKDSSQAIKPWQSVTNTKKEPMGSG